MNSRLNKRIIQIITVIFLITFIPSLILKNKLLYQAIFEIITIILAANMFIIALRGYNISQNSYFKFLGFSYGFVAFFEMLHFLSHTNVGVVDSVHFDLETQLWLIARSIEAVALVLSFRYLNKKFKLNNTVIISSISFLIGILFIVKQGLVINNFQLIVELIIISMLITAIVLLFKNKKRFHIHNFKYLFIALLTTIVTEILFIVQQGSYDDILHTVVHGLKLLSIYFVYLAVVKKLTEEVNKLNKAVEQSPSTVVITNDKGEIEYVNPKFTEITGYEYEEVKGENPRVLKSEYHSEEFYNDLWETIKSGNEWRDEFYNCKKNGEYYWEDASISGIKDNDGTINHFLKVGEEITNRKEYEKKLKEKSRQLEEANDKITEDLNKAKAMHEQFLPSCFPKVDDISFATYYQPAKKLGGDFYNIIKIDDLLIFYIVDVTGHGLDGAMLNIFIRGAIDSFLLSNPPLDQNLVPSKIIEFIVQEFQEEDFPADYFICLEVGILNLETMELRISNSGIQIPPLIVAKNGDIREINCIDLPISAVISLDKYDVKDKMIQLQPGDHLFLTTDGLIEENINGEQYGVNRLEKILTRNCYLAPEFVLKEVLDDFSDFSGTKQGKDDITIFSLYYQPEKLIDESWVLENNLDEFYEFKEELTILLEKFDIKSDLKQGILIAVQELVINAMEHGNQFDQEKNVFIETIFTDYYFKIVVEDQGEGFNWEDAIEYEGLKLEQGVERGRGIIITNMVSDYLTYDHQGRKAIFIKKLEG
ncbi:MAG: MASE3 domain-containing protein [Bacillota bacterium]